METQEKMLQRKIDNMKEMLLVDKKYMDKIEAENTKLKEALEKIDNKVAYLPDGIKNNSPTDKLLSSITEIIKQALKS